MSKKGKFVKNSAIYTIGDMLPKVISFFMIPVLTRCLTTDDYGVVNYFTTVMSFFSVFYILGVDGALTRFYYDYKEIDDKKKFISTLWIFLFVYNVSVTLFFVFCGKGISNLFFKSIPFSPFFRMMVINCFLITFTTMPMVLFRLKEEAFKFGMFNILNTVIYVFFIFYFVAYYRQGALGNVKAILYTNIIFAAVYFLIVYKYIVPKFSFPILKTALKYGIPLIPHAIGGWALMVSDRWVMGAYRTKSELGIYTLAYQFGMIVTYLIGAINKAYVPFFFKTSDENKNAPVIFEEILKYYSIFILSIGLGLALFSKEIILLMSTGRYLEAYKIVPIIALAYMFDGYYYMAVNGIFYSKKTHVLAATTGTTAVIDVILNFILIPRYGMYGAAYATAISYFIMFILTYINSQRYYYIRWHWKDIISNGLIAICIYIVGNITIKGVFLEILYKVFLYALYVVLLFLFKILSYDKFLYYKNVLIKKVKGRI